jgi:hypothetical protein
MMVRALGVYRESEFSPGKVGADAAILDAVLTLLTVQGVATSSVSAAEFVRTPITDWALILAMCQGEAALARLSAYQSRGVMVINSPAAIRSCYRDRLGELLTRAGAPVPRGILVDTWAAISRCSISGLDLRRGIYIKRGDLHALSAEDVKLVDNEASLGRVLGEVAARGIRRAYLQSAVEGKVVKFYGVTGTDYFTTAEAASDRELMAGLPKAARDAAAALGLEVWGGDAIVDGQQFKIIDFNDWPSFERVRAQAAQAIAERALQKMRKEK